MKHRPASLRRTLLLGILLPVFGYVVFNTVVLYRQALAAADTAYDRTLLATAKSLGEQLEVVGTGEQAVVRSSLLYSALEAFEADNRSRLFYRVSGFQGEMVSGFEDMPPPRRDVPQDNIYAALNQRLIDAGVLPNLKYSAQRNSQPARPRSNAAATEPTADSSRAATAPATTSPKPRPKKPEAKPTAKSCLLLLKVWPTANSRQKLGLR